MKMYGSTILVILWLQYKNKLFTYQQNIYTTITNSVNNNANYLITKLRQKQKQFIGKASVYYKI